MIHRLSAISWQHLQNESNRNRPESQLISSNSFVVRLKMKKTASNQINQVKLNKTKKIDYFQKTKKKCEYSWEFSNYPTVSAQSSPQLHDHHRDPFQLITVQFDFLKYCFSLFINIVSITIWILVTSIYPTMSMDPCSQIDRWSIWFP